MNDTITIYLIIGNFLFLVVLSAYIHILLKICDKIEKNYFEWFEDISTIYVVIVFCYPLIIFAVILLLILQEKDNCIDFIVNYFKKKR